MKACAALFSVILAAAGAASASPETTCGEAWCARKFVESDPSPPRIRKLIRSPNIHIATAATYAFSRTARPPPDFVAVLEYARARKVLDDEALHGEFAHAVFYAAHPAQLEMLTKIDRTESTYARDILASNFGNPVALARLSPAAQRALASFLLRREPKFDLALGAYGMFDAMRYSDWLNTLALLKSRGINGRYNAVVLAALDDSGTDPRKIMAYLHSSHGERLINEVGAVRLAVPLRRIAEYADSLPQQEGMRDTVSEVQRRALQAGPAAKD